MLTAMPMELAPLRRRMQDRRPFAALGSSAVAGRLAGVEIVATTVGVGTRAAVAATEQVLRAVSVPHVLVVGIAGASAPHLRIGDVVVPETVIHGPSAAPYESTAFGGAHRQGTILTSDELLVEAEAVAALHRRGITAMDMETGSIAAVCDRHDVPWTAFRAISDTVDRPVDKDVMSLLSRDGTPNVGAALRFIVRRPHKIPHLVSLARDSSRACDAAAAAAERALKNLKSP